jgi:hypothetical protein
MILFNREKYMTKIEKYLRAHLDANPKFVAEKFKRSLSYVYVVKTRIRKELAEQAKKNKSSTIEELMPKTVADRMKLLKAVKAFEANAVDNVNHPPHYKVGGIETIDFIEAKKLNYNLGNVIKYITRADHKGSRNEDLKKALWYLNREITRK